MGGVVPLCKQHYAYLQKIVPDLQLFNWGMRPVTDDWGWGYTKAWAPNVSAWYQEAAGIDRARKEGVKVFAYTCGAGYPTLDRRIMVPDICLYDENIQRRVYGWLYDKLDLDGMLIFMMNGWSPQTPVAPSGYCEWSRKRETRWPKSEWLLDAGTTYWLVYPGPEGYLWPSLRLDALRDGLEDYEYLHAARELLKKQKNTELEKILAGDQHLVQSIESYAQDPAIYNQRKAELARFLSR